MSFLPTQSLLSLRDEDEYRCCACATFGKWTSRRAMQPRGLLAPIPGPLCHRPTRTLQVLQEVRTRVGSGFHAPAPLSIVSPTQVPHRWSSPRAVSHNHCLCLIPNSCSAGPLRVPCLVSRPSCLWAPFPPCRGSCVRWSSRRDTPPHTVHRCHILTAPILKRPSSCKSSIYDL